MKKILLLIVFTMCVVFIAEAQTAPPSTVPGGPTSTGVNIPTGGLPVVFRSKKYRTVGKPPKKLERKYDRATRKITYAVYLKDGSKLEANSEILKEQATGKHYMYYSGKDSLTKIFPEATAKVEKPNPFNLDESIEGKPVGNKWRFQLTNGKISSWSSFVSGKEPEEVQFEDGGEIVLVSSPKFEEFIKTNEKAFSAYQKKQYYTAISIYNQN